MKKLTALFLSIALALGTVNISFAEGWGSFFSNIGSTFDSSESSENSSSSSWLQNLGTLTGNLFAAETGIPKEIHYGDYELFKQDIDILEAYFQSYADFLKNYDVNDIGMLAEYAEMMVLYSEAMLVLDSLDEAKMSSKEERYYLNTLNRINKILLETLGDI